jgi:hypothetical protein
LPQKGSAAVSLITPLAAPASVAEHHGLGLDYLSQVDVGLRMLVLMKQRAIESVFIPRGQWLSAGSPPGK